MSVKTSFGVIGAGLMGAGIAGRLLAAGHPVALLIHRNRAPVEPLLALGASEATGAEMLVEGCDVLLTCLPDAETVEELSRKIGTAFRPGQVWIDVTTSRPETSRVLAARLSGKGATFADAPVTGGPEQAADGTLASLVGCEEKRFPEIERLVGPYSKVVHRFGDPGSGNVAKLLNNLVTQGTMTLLADAFRCAALCDIDMSALYDAMMRGAGRSGTLEKAVGPALLGRYDGAKFTIRNAAKDLRYASELVGSVEPERAELARTLADRLAKHVEKGRGEWYVSMMLDPERDR